MNIERSCHQATVEIEFLIMDERKRLGGKYFPILELILIREIGKWREELERKKQEFIKIRLQYFLGAKGAGTKFIHIGREKHTCTVEEFAVSLIHELVVKELIGIEKYLSV